jgi:hypothetical protein
MVPFFVVDRPISLEIIKGVHIPASKKIGLMAHANTSENFRKAFREYPSKQTIKMCDSAIFHPQRDKNTYKYLFDKYKEMGADYGIIIDVLRDPNATIKSAEEALRVYRATKNYTFKLVAVAQGNNTEEFLDCYLKLKTLGFEYIAVGGLLHKREQSARYMKVKDESLMKDVLFKIREKFNPKWLFVLGCLHPSRLNLFKELDVWGDYKGWIFEYKKRNDALKQVIEKFKTNHLKHESTRFKTSKLNADLVQLLIDRDNFLEQREKVHDNLINAKRNLRKSVNFIHKELQILAPEKCDLLFPFLSRGFLSESNQKLITKLTNEFTALIEHSNKVIALSKKSRNFKNKLIKIEKKLEGLNERFLLLLELLKDNKLVGKEAVKFSTDIIKILSLTEQQFRISQVQRFIENKLL